jgi:moderate conductance mechanosensitive channel
VVATPTPIPSTASPTPSITVPTLSDLSRSVSGACGTDPGTLCRTVYNLTHSRTLASGAEFFLAAPAHILIILLVAIVVRTLFHRFINRTTRHAAHGGVTGVLGSTRAATAVLGAFGDPTVLLERRRQRAETVGSLARSLVSIAVFGIAFVTILGELGINLAPIVASAGVIGLAVGFGAQNLVKDFLSGMFMLLEDQYGVGDVIDVGTAVGTVEAVSLRITRVRDVRGAVWYVRNGEITRIGNKSQNWSRAVLDIPLSYDTSVTRAREIITHTADELWGDPAFSAIFLEQPQVWGVEEMNADGYTIRLVAKTLPSRQDDVARALRERLRDALQVAGIELGAENRQEITVRDGSDDGSSDDSGDSDDSGSDDSDSDSDDSDDGFGGQTQQGGAGGSGSGGGGSGGGGAGGSGSGGGGPGLNWLS